MTILGFIGGTGPEGMGLALRWAARGHTALIGSRDPGRAEAKAAELRARLPGAEIRGLGNSEAAGLAEIAFVCVPFAGHADTLAALRDQLAGKLVCDVVVPMTFEKGKGAMVVPADEGSAAQQAAALLPESTVVAGFQNLSAELLLDLEHELEGDAIICGDDRDAKGRLMELAGQLGGIRPVDGGPLRNARIVEALTVLLLSINRIYRARTHVRIVGLPESRGAPQ